MKNNTFCEAGKRICETSMVFFFLSRFFYVRHARALRLRKLKRNSSRNVTTESENEKAVQRVISFSLLECNTSLGVT